MTKFEFTDRYDALNIPPPNPKTMCKGQCEGTGWVPLQENGPDEHFRLLWKRAHAAAGDGHECGGWHFIKCPDCAGTGKRISKEEG